MPRAKPLASPPRAPRTSAGALAARAVGWTLVLAVPLLGAWLASSLAAYGHHGPWKSALVGLLLFPVAPAVWELASTLRSGKKRYLETKDRLVLRTLFLSFAFFVALLALFPKTAFTALSTRGDWMFDGQTGPYADRGRTLTHSAAKGLEWLYLATRDAPFEQSDVAPTDLDPPTPVASATAPTPTPTPTSTPTPTPTPIPAPTPTPTSPPAAFSWPSPAPLSPLVQTIPKDAETTPASVGAYIAQHEPTQQGRARAAHDWVADRIAYDGPSYVAGRYPPQDAETVFRTRTGVCAGYARLFAAIAKSAGLEARYVVGTVRGTGMRPDGESHAWNAVKVDGAWLLVDTTWDAGHLDGPKFVKEYGTVYYGTPPEAFRVDHFPNEAEWQLAREPLDRGEFFRRPMMSAAFFADGLTLKTPDRSQVSTEGPFRVEIENPSRLFLIVEDQKTKCAVSREATRLEATCPLEQRGAHDVKLYASRVEYGMYHYVGQFEVTRL